MKMTGKETLIPYVNLYKCQTHSKVRTGLVDLTRVAQVLITKQSSERLPTNGKIELEI